MLQKKIFLLSLTSLILTISSTFPMDPKEITGWSSSDEDTAITTSPDPDKAAARQQVEQVILKLRNGESMLYNKDGSINKMLLNNLSQGKRDLVRAGYDGLARRLQSTLRNALTRHHGYHRNPAIEIYLNAFQDLYRQKAYN